MSPIFQTPLGIPEDVEELLHDLAAEAASLRVEFDGELPGPAELLGYVDAVAYLQATGRLPSPAGARA